MTRVSSIVLITEGYEDSAFARAFLGEAGLSRAIQLRENPRGKGSGYGFVIGQFVAEAKNLERFREGHGVIALIDEDGQTVSERVRAIDDSLAVAGLPGISASQGRCLLVPVRNIETWVFWLRAHASNRTPVLLESEDYKRRGPLGEPALEKRDFAAAGKYLHQFQHDCLPSNMLPALAQGLVYLRDFVRAVKR